MQVDEEGPRSVRGTEGERYLYKRILGKTHIDNVWFGVQFEDTEQQLQQQLPV